MSRVLAPVVLSPIAGAGSALADNTTCAGAIFVVPDGSMHSGQEPSRGLRGPDRDWTRAAAAIARARIQAR